MAATKSQHLALVASYEFQLITHDLWARSPSTRNSSISVNRPPTEEVRFWTVLSWTANWIEIKRFSRFKRLGTNLWKWAFLIKELPDCLTQVPNALLTKVNELLVQISDSQHWWQFLQTFHIMWTFCDQCPLDAMLSVSAGVTDSLWAKFSRFFGRTNLRSFSLVPKGKSHRGLRFGTFFVANRLQVVKFKMLFILIRYYRRN